MKTWLGVTIVALCTIPVEFSCVAFGTVCVDAVVCDGEVCIFVLKTNDLALRGVLFVIYVLCCS